MGQALEEVGQEQQAHCMHVINIGRADIEIKNHLKIFSKYSDSSSMLHTSAM